MEDRCKEWITRYDARNMKKCLQSWKGNLLYVLEYAVSQTTLSLLWRFEHQYERLSIPSDC